MDKKSTEPEKNTLCLVCGKEAEFHCIECNKVMCQACHTYHNAFMKDHYVVTIEEVQSGQVTTEGRVCDVHGEQVRYYCETEDRQVCAECINLKTCPMEDERVTLKEAARKQQDLINGLIDGLKHKFADNKKMFQNSIWDNTIVLSTLRDSVKQTKTSIVNWREQIKQEVDQEFDKELEKVDGIQRDRFKELEDKTNVLELQLAQMEEAEKQASDIITLKSEFLITYKFSSLSKKLNELSIVEPIPADKSLGYLAYESIPMRVPTSGYLLQSERWRLIDQFPTQGMTEPKGIAVNHDGDIAVASFQKGVKVFSRDGQVKCSFMNDFKQITDLTVSHDNRYIVASGEIKDGLKFYTSKGKLLSCVTVKDIINMKSYLNSVAVDADDRIIAGLVNNTISIHYAGGSLISKFATMKRPFRLAATSEGEIVSSSFDGKCVALMDYFGNHLRQVEPPPDVKKWAPGYVCSRQGEIFVANRGVGDPAGIFRYTSTGDYLGCVTTEVTMPAGLSLSKDGMELFVVDIGNCEVKIFHRE